MCRIALNALISANFVFITVFFRVWNMFACLYNFNILEILYIVSFTSVVHSMPDLKFCSWISWKTNHPATAYHHLCSSPVQSNSNGWGRQLVWGWLCTWNRKVIDDRSSALNHPHFHVLLSILYFAAVIKLITLIALGWLNGSLHAPSTYNSFLILERLALFISVRELLLTSHY